MADYDLPNWRDAYRVYAKFCQTLMEPALIAVVLLLLDAKWWWFVGLFLLWLPLARVRVKELRNEWTK